MNEEVNQMEKLNDANELVKITFEEIITEIEKNKKDTVWICLFKSVLCNYRYNGRKNILRMSNM